MIFGCENLFVWFGIFLFMKGIVKSLWVFGRCDFVIFLSSDTFAGCNKLNVTRLIFASMWGNRE